MSNQGRNGGDLDYSVMGNRTSLVWGLDIFEGCVSRISVEAISKDLNLRKRKEGVRRTEMEKCETGCLGWCLEVQLQGGKT